MWQKFRKLVVGIYLYLFGNFFCCRILCPEFLGTQFQSTVYHMWGCIKSVFKSLIMFMPWVLFIPWALFIMFYLNPIILCTVSKQKYYWIWHKRVSGQNAHYHGSLYHEWHSNHGSCLCRRPCSHHVVYLGLVWIMDHTPPPLGPHQLINPYPYPITFITLLHVTKIWAQECKSSMRAVWKYKKALQEHESNVLVSPTPLSVKTNQKQNTHTGRARLIRTWLIRSST